MPLWLFLFFITTSEVITFFFARISWWFSSASVITAFLALKKPRKFWVWGCIKLSFSFFHSILIHFNKICKLLNCSFINSIIKYHLGILPKVKMSAFSNREILIIDSNHRKLFTTWAKVEELWTYHDLYGWIIFIKLSQSDCRVCDGFRG